VTRHRRAALTVALAALVTTGLAACGAGNSAQTNQPQNVGDGVQITQGDIQALNALVVAPPEGSQQAVVSVTISNTGTTEQRLQGIASDAGEVKLTGDTVVKPGGTLQVGLSDAPASALIDGFTRKAGESVVLTLDMSDEGQIPVETYSYPPEGIFADWVAPTAPAG
jgi:copper(I)-binding protein